MLELVVAVGIIGVMAAIAVPTLVKRLPEYRLRSATRDIVSCLQEAKMRAVNENADTVIFFDAANGQYTAWVDNGAGADAGNRTLETASGEIVFKQITLPSDITIYNITGLSTDKLAYNSRGIPASNVGTIFVRNNKSNYRAIIVNIAGNIRTQRSNDNVSWD